MLRAADVNRRGQAVSIDTVPPRPTLTIPLPGSLGRRLREGALCNLDRAVGRIRFQEWATGQIRTKSHA
jgi:hypothetical protein